MEKLEHLCSLDGNVKWCSCYGNQYGVPQKKVNIDLLYDPAISLLAVYSKELKAGFQRIIHTYP